jgi:hypothetical protein
MMSRFDGQQPRGNVETSNIIENRQHTNNIAMMTRGGTPNNVDNVRHMTPNQQTYSDNMHRGVSPAQQYQDLLARHGYTSVGGSPASNSAFQSSMNVTAPGQSYGNPAPAAPYQNPIGYMTNNSYVTHGGDFGPQNQRQSASMETPRQPNPMVFDLEPTPIEQMSHRQNPSYDQQMVQQQRQQQHQLQQLQQQQRLYQQQQLRQQQEQQQNQWYQQR